LLDIVEKPHHKLTKISILKLTTLGDILENGRVLMESRKICSVLSEYDNVSKVTLGLSHQRGNPSGVTAARLDYVYAYAARFCLMLLASIFVQLRQDIEVRLRRKNPSNQFLNDRGGWLQCVRAALIEEEVEAIEDQTYSGLIEISEYPGDGRIGKVRRFP